ncbi:MAG: GNAT family N-acetyltransferase [Peptococcaceae bacterium]|nr:GNAT family N-acetyltransferase [Peptococcaceae bacterium]
MTIRQVRLAADTDRPAIEALWAYCFNDGETFQRWYFNHYYRKDECLVACLDDMIVASLQMIDLPTRVGGKTVRAAYIVGVDCLPEYRGMGFTRQLMEEALLHYAPAHHLQLLHLMPFEADFYEPYGFVFSDYHFQMALDMNEFYRPSDRALARRYSWRSLNLEDATLAQMLPALEALYERSTKRYDMAVERKGERRWRALLDDLAMEGGHVKLLYDDKEMLVGCLAYIMKEDAFFVREALSVHAEAKRAIYYFIASHRSQVKRVDWSAPLDEAVVFQRQKDKDNVRFQPFMMNLILDPTILPLFTQCVPEKDLLFAVEDCGCYCWKKGRKSIEKVAQKTADAPVLEKRLLTQMVFDRSWIADEKDTVQCELAALFTEKPRIFNNEYF